jgi:hypothetical protein
MRSLQGLTPFLPKPNGEECYAGLRRSAFSHRSLDGSTHDHNVEALWSVHTLDKNLLDVGSATRSSY